MNPDSLFDVGSELLGVACAGLAEADLIAEHCCDPAHPDARAFVATGAVAWDTCCDGCGQLTVRLADLFESATPPVAAVGPHPCDRVLIAEWEVLFLSCVTVAENAEAQPPILPSAATTNLEAARVLAAVKVLWSSLACLFNEWRKSYSDLVGWHVTGGLVGPEGGCVGASVTVQTVVGPSCDCSPIVDPAPIP